MEKNIPNGISKLEDEMLESVNGGAGIGGGNTNSSSFRIDADKCVSCGVCADACPCEAISKLWNDIYTIETSKCIGCGTCEGMCPAQAIELL